MPRGRKAGAAPKVRRSLQKASGDDANADLADFRKYLNAHLGTQLSASAYFGRVQQIVRCNASALEQVVNDDSGLELLLAEQGEKAKLFQAPLKMYRRFMLERRARQPAVDGQEQASPCAAEASATPPETAPQAEPAAAAAWPPALQRQPPPSPAERPRSRSQPRAGSLAELSQCLSAGTAPPPRPRGRSLNRTVEADPGNVPGRAATAEEEKEFPAIMERFTAYLSRTHKQGTAHSYRCNVVTLFTQFKRAPSTMANSMAFLRFVENMPKNKASHSVLSASLKAYRNFCACDGRSLQTTLFGAPKPNVRVDLEKKQPEPAVPRRETAGAPASRERLSQLFAKAAPTEDEGGVCKDDYELPEPSQPAEECADEAEAGEEEEDRRLYKVLSTALGGEEMQDDSQEDLPEEELRAQLEEAASQASQREELPSQHSEEPAAAAAASPEIVDSDGDEAPAEEAAEPEGAGAGSQKEEEHDVAAATGESTEKDGKKVTPVKKRKSFMNKHNSGDLKSVKVEEWIREVSRRYPSEPPQRQSSLFEKKESRTEHIDANILDVVRQRAVKVGLGPFLRCRLCRPKWGSQHLEEWDGQMKVRAQEREQQLQEEEPGDEEAEEDGKNEEDEGGKGWAAVHTIRLIGERWGAKRPVQRWYELKKAKQAGQEHCDQREEHEAAVSLKVMRMQYLEGALAEASFDALLELPESWALDMLLTWQAHLMLKVRAVADAFPEKMPSHSELDNDSEPARWVREFRRQAATRSGLGAHVASELKAWLPWGAEAVEQWSRLSGKDAKRSSPGNERAQPLERLRGVVANYPDAPPVKRVYVSSEEEREEQSQAVYLEKLGRLHFCGAVTSDAVNAVAGNVPWVPALVEQWELNKQEGRDPEEAMFVQRLRDIGERHQQPPTQISALERERWALPHEQRIRHVDAWFLKELKERFFERGLSQAVQQAFAEIPIWGEPRLEEWRVQKDQRASQIFEKQHRAWHKRASEEEGTQGATEDDSRMRALPAVLYDSDRLLRTGKEPRNHEGRVRISSCDGKTVSEALSSVRTGVLHMKLTRRIIAQDIMSGHLKVEQTGGEAAEAARKAEPGTPSRMPSRPRLAFTGKKRMREERYRSLTGKVVSVDPTPLKCKKELSELKNLLPHQIDQLSHEELLHYERQLGWSSKRALSERLDKLNKESQVKPLPWSPAASNGSAAGSVEISELTQYQRLQLSAHDLEQMEQQRLIADGMHLPAQQRRDRLRDYVWKLTGESVNKSQNFMKQWQSKERPGIMTIEDDEDDDGE